MTRDEETGLSGDVVPMTETDELAHMQAVLAVLVRRCGGSTTIAPAELEAAVGHGLRLTHDEAGITLESLEPLRAEVEFAERLVEPDGETRVEAAPSGYLH